MDDAADKIVRARELLTTVHHAAMATVNTDGTPLGTPYFFACSDDLTYLYWGSHPDSEHSKNIARTGQVFVVLYDAFSRGGLFIRADAGHATEGEELKTALKAFNARRIKMGKQPVPIEQYQGKSPQRLYMATVQKLWTNMSEKDADGLVIRDVRFEITRQQLLH